TRGSTDGPGRAPRWHSQRWKEQRARLDEPDREGRPRRPRGRPSTADRIAAAGLGAPPAAAALPDRWPARRDRAPRFRAPRRGPLRRLRGGPRGARVDVLPYGPFETLAGYRAFVEAECLGEDPLFHAVVPRSDGRAAGVAAYLRAEPEFGVIEVGHICYAPRLQRTSAATEAMYLLARRAFEELGYR